MGSPHSTSTIFHGCDRQRKVGFALFAVNSGLFSDARALAEGGCADGRPTRLELHVARRFGIPNHAMRSSLATQS